MTEKIGGFEMGMYFDAQLIELEAPVETLAAEDDVLVERGQEDTGNIDLFGWENWTEKIEKWVWNGDDGNVRAVWTVAIKARHTSSGSDQGIEQHMPPDLPNGRSDLPSDNLSSKGAPWIMIGGSYSGMRAAFTRNEYPDTIYAANASSAPVQAQVDMSIYFEQLYRGMAANGYES
ncbi:serine carboxypeptidase S28-domain-containing protein [Talaromyces proteolyticus]|uniref:Serine carboxypeptidase S28-domain-containing protein n=1 Tax=Talaromyces proteolyticus TaxID=1131652 RepID=A0AAD4Q4H5_9EURO|nr:serine carboxypeptidase S28-domain-containing protein [Talaromyces proteolyticus]KAH8703025.1 serine carboxypeptidase S28-domain-containing protein [Talaromyces proteolyticus]